MNKDNDTQTRFYCAIKENSIINQRDVQGVFKNEYENNDITDEEQLREILNYAKYYYYITNYDSDLEL